MDFLDVLVGLVNINNSIDTITENPPQLHISPLEDKSTDNNWAITFSIDNVSWIDIYISPTVTATFNTRDGRRDMVFIISDTDTKIPGKNKKVLTAFSEKYKTKPSQIHDLYQVHITPLPT